MNTSNNEEVMTDYVKCFDSLSDWAMNVVKPAGISQGVMSVVLVRMAAMTCRIHEMTEDDFTEFARQHYKMIQKTADTAIEDEKAG